MLLGTLDGSLLRNLLSGKGVIQAGNRVIRVGDGTKKKKRFLMPFHILTNIKIQRYYQNKSNFKGVCSRDNLLNTVKEPT